MENTRKVQKPQKLTGDRAARKREQDRQAQRSAREKTKKLIAHLESRIETLTRFHNSGNVQELIDELEVQRKANETLRTTLRSIEKTISTGLAEASTALRSYNPGKKEPDAESPAVDKQNGKQEGPSRDDSVISQQISPPASEHHPTHPHNAGLSFEASTMFEKCMSENPFVHLHDGMSLTNKPPYDIFTFTPPPQQAFPPEIPMSMPMMLQTTDSPCSCCKQMLHMNDMIGRFSLTCTRVMSNQRLRDMDIPIRAVLHGWDTVCHLYPLDPIWTMLRGADETVWRECGVLERLAVLRVVSSMLRYLTDPSEANLSYLPKFMRQRPSQHRIVHKPLIDFIVWPGLRERLILFPHQHCSEKFWSLFWSSFRFIWPHSLQDSLVQQCQTGLYRFSDIFNKYYYDLQSWCMTPAFVQEFPDLEEDVNVVPISPESTPASPDNEGFAMGNGGLSQENVSMPTNLFTAFQSADWSAARNHLF